MSVMEPLPQPFRKSITFDRGIEVRNWCELKSGIGTEAWSVIRRHPVGQCMAKGFG